MQESIAIALGGALGALARYWTGVLVVKFAGGDFPWSTLLVNVAGSLAMGVLFVLIVEKSYLSGLWRSLAIVGFLGAFTTFSTFSLQAFALFEEGRFLAAVGYVLSSVVLCLAASAAGVVVTRQF